jgi:chromosome segregation ATPase
MSTPAIQINESVAALKARIRQLEGEIRTLNGKISNRSTSRAQAVQKENQQLGLRVSALESKIAELLTQSTSPAQADDLKQQTEILRQVAIEYCQHNKIDPELWKNLAY